MQMLVYRLLLHLCRIDNVYQDKTVLQLDPLFWLPELQVSSAELSKEEKNKISHRGQAMQLFRESLQK